MDIQMPVVDGYEATWQIKANPALKTIPVIVVTSYALSGDEDKARAAGCDDYITKPYSPRRSWQRSKSICISVGARASHAHPSAYSHRR
jgi:two-component system, cell cycle response regulator DivK